MQSMMTKVGLNLQKFMRHSDIETIPSAAQKPKHNFKADHSEVKEVDCLSDAAVTRNIQREPRSMHATDNLKQRNRAQSLQNHRRQFNSTGERKSSVKKGLTAFIRESNIDLDELSANLSQKQEVRVMNRSRSKSDQSRKGVASGPKGSAAGPGLPLPKGNPKKLAQTYRQQAMNMRKHERLPTPKSLRDLPRPVEQPQIIDHNEQTFSNMKKFVKSPEQQASPVPRQRSDARNEESPNFYDPEAEHREQVTQHDSGNTGLRREAFQLDLQQMTQSEQRRLGHCFSQGMSAEKDGGAQNADISMAPVGTIVRVQRTKSHVPNRTHKKLQNYSTFGEKAQNGQVIKSMSPVKQRAKYIEAPLQRPPKQEQLAVQPLRPSWISEDVRPKHAGAGKIVRQSEISRASQKSNHSVNSLPEQIAEPDEEVYSPRYEPDLRDYEYIKQDIMASLQEFDFDSTQRHILLPFFRYTYILLKKIRRGVQILQHERLEHMVQELTGLQARLEQRQQVCQDTLKQAIKESRNPETALKSHSTKLKHEILRDICARLRQKVVIYAWQLMIYQKQEVVILFEKYFHEVYQFAVQKFYLAMMRRYARHRKEQRDISEYVCQSMQHFRLQSIFGKWVGLKFVTMQKEMLKVKAKENFQQCIVLRAYKGLKVHSASRRLKAIDQLLLNKYARVKLCLQLFLKWRERLRKLKLAKFEALSALKEGAVQGLKLREPLEESQLKARLAAVQDSMYDHKYAFLIGQRNLALKNLRQIASRCKETFPRFSRSTQPEHEEAPCFRSLIKNQNPQAYKTEDQQTAFNLKYDIHTLLVDTQNYFKQDEGRPVGQRVSFPLTGRSSSREPLIRSLMPPLFTGLNDTQLVPKGGDGQNLGGAKPPNQLFRMLERQNQMVKTKHLPAQVRRLAHEEVESMVSRAKAQVKGQITQLFTRIKEVRNEEGYSKHYSFAVKFLIREEQNIQVYQHTENDGYTNTVTYTNTRRSQRGDQSYLESSPGYQENAEIGTQREGVPVESQRDRYAVHVPHFSVASVQKDKYSLEDYIQFAQNQVQFEDVNDDQPKKLAQEMFLRLQIAKAASVYFTEWKIALLTKHLLQCLDHLHNLNLMGQYFRQLKQVQSIQAKHADEFYSTLKLRCFYRLFLKWRHSNSQIVVHQKKMLRKFRQRVVFRRWVDYMTLQGDYLLMVLQAQKYHHQALTSKALLSLYTHTLKQSKAARFRRKCAFTKFFKRKWMPQYEKSRALRKVLEQVCRRDLQWERQRYQREFNMMMGVFYLWVEFARQQRQYVLQYDALCHYRHTLLIKCFTKWSSRIRITHGARLVAETAALTRILPCFEQLKRYSLKTEIMQRDWRTHRVAYLQGQIIMQWREHTVKQKLAKMLLKKRVLTKLKTYVFQKNFSIPHQFWMRYRQILFFKILKYLAQRKSQKHKKHDMISRSLNGVSEQLKKKAFIALLQNVYGCKRKQMLRKTVAEFRAHKLTEFMFKMLKIGCLNLKKDRILAQVATDFRTSRLDAGHAFVVPPRDNTRLEMSQSQVKVAMQKVFTAWLQFTLDNFVKGKLLARYNQFKRHKTLRQAFDALIPGAFNMPSAPRDPRPSYHNTPHDPDARHTPLYMVRGNDYVASASQVSNAYVESSSKPSILRQSAQSGLPEQIMASGELHHLRSSMSGKPFIQTTETKKHLRFADELTSHPSVSYEQTPIDSRSGGLSSQSPQRTSDVRNNKNQRLFQELEDIFLKNKMWMQEQKDREIIIKKLADQYQDKMLQNSQSQHTRSRMFEHESLTGELEMPMERGYGEEMSEANDTEFQLQKRQRSEHELGSSYLSGPSPDSKLSASKASLSPDRRGITDTEDSKFHHYLKSEAELQRSKEKYYDQSPVPRFGLSHHYHGSVQPRTQARPMGTEEDSSIVMGKLGLLSGSAVTSGDQELVYSGPTGMDRSVKTKTQYEMVEFSESTERRLKNTQNRYMVENADLTGSPFSNLIKDMR